MTTHQKGTFDSFKKKLKAGEYKGVTGVKRALGKFKGWEQADKDRALKAAERHFNSGGASKASTKPAKKATKKTAPTKRGPKKTAPAPTAGRGRKKRAPKKESLGAAIDSAGKAVEVATSGISALNQVNQISGGKIDVNQSLEHAKSALDTAMSFLNKAVTSAWRANKSNGVDQSPAEKATTQKFVESKPATAPSPPTSSPS